MQDIVESQVERRYCEILVEVLEGRPGQKLLSVDVLLNPVLGPGYF